MKFNSKQTIDRIDKYHDTTFEEVEKVEKVFYHFNEWSGWRFYLKAIRHKDWRSIKKHIKSKFI